MGTRSLTFFYEDGKPFAAFYRQFDGYPTGHGAELGKYLSNVTLVNGYQMGQDAPLFANGPGCLAAQVVAEFKSQNSIGGIYLIDPNPESNKDGFHDYEYHIFIESVPVSGWVNRYQGHIECRDPKRVIFSGSFGEFYEWAQEPKTDGDSGEYIPVIKRPPVTVSTYDDIGTALHSEIVEVTFEKADGTERKMVCTKDFNRIPEDKIPTGEGSNVNTDPRLYRVFDLEKNDWRSFREERIIDWQVQR